MKAAISLRTLATLAALGCQSKGEGTSLVVTVWSDLAVPAQINAVDVVIAEGELSFPFSLGTAAGQRQFPLRAAVVPGSANDRQFEVEVVGRLDNRPTVTQTAAVSFVPGEAQELVLFLSRNCSTIPACPIGASCQDGHCLGKDMVGVRRLFDPHNTAGPPNIAGPTRDGAADRSDAFVSSPLADASFMDAANVVDAGGGGGTGGAGGSVGTGGTGGGGGPSPDAGGIGQNGKTVLLVMGYTTPKDAALRPSDAKMKMRLESRGFTVRQGDDDDPDASKAMGTDLVIITDTVGASIGAKYTTLMIPVICADSGLFDDLKMTGNATGDHGTANVTQIVITNMTSTLAAGIMGSVTVTGGAQPANWGNPSAAAQKVATIPDQASQIALFGYPSGAMMNGLTAPAKRVGFFATENMANSMNDNGWKLFDAAVDWALSP